MRRKADKKTKVRIGSKYWRCGKRCYSPCSKKSKLNVIQMLLKVIKVLDLSTLLPGPMCSLFLADLGAEVIKIESPKGDFMRHFEAADGRSPYFDALNRNKKSVVLDLKAKENKSIFMELAKNADVIIEGFRPGKVDALGLGYKDVKKINPRI